VSSTHSLVIVGVGGYLTLSTHCGRGRVPRRGVKGAYPIGGGTRPHKGGEGCLR